MFRLWGKIWTDNHLIKDMVVENSDDDTRTHKIFHGIENICYAYDLSKPIWLNSNIEEFKKSRKTRFTKDNFVDEINFDYLEIQVLEED